MRMSRRHTLADRPGTESFNKGPVGRARSARASIYGRIGNFWANSDFFPFLKKSLDLIQI